MGRKSVVESTAKDQAAARDHLERLLGQQALFSGLLAMHAGKREQLSFAHHLRHLVTAFETEGIDGIRNSFEAAAQSLAGYPDLESLRPVEKRLPSGRQVAASIREWLSSGERIRGQLAALANRLEPLDGYWSPSNREATSATVEAVEQWLQRWNIKKERASVAAHLAVAAGTASPKTKEDWLALTTSWQKRLTGRRSFARLKRRRVPAIAKQREEDLGTLYLEQLVNLYLVDRNAACARYGRENIEMLEESASKLAVSEGRTEEKDLRK